jgi:hypothetical protein
MSEQKIIEELANNHRAMLAEIKYLKGLVEQMGTLDYGTLKERLEACEATLQGVARWAFERDDDQPNIHWMTQDQNDGHAYAVSEIRNLLRHHGIKSFQKKGSIVRGGEEVKRSVLRVVDEMVSGHTEKKPFNPDYDAGVVYACHEIREHLEPSDRQDSGVTVTPISSKEA